jgi:hypothetical protein
VKDVPSGIYSIQIRGDKGVMNRKMVITK